MAESSSLIAKVRCAHQKYGDFNIEVKLDWSVRDLKVHLNLAYPSKPDPSLQRLVFAGQLMQDAEMVASYLSRFPDIDLPIIHLVYTPTIAEQRQKTPPVVPESELRRRKPVQQQHETTPAPPSGQQILAPGDDAINGGQPLGSMSHQFFAGGQNFVPSAAGFNLQPQPFPSMNPHPYMNQYFQYLQQLYGPMYWPYGGHFATAAGGTNVVSFTAVPQMMFPGTGGIPQVGSAVDVPVGAQAVADGTQAVPAVPQNLPQQAAVPQPPQRDLAMNAQGGVAEDDDEGRNRDWLDYIYTAARAGLLFVILYSYSSMERLTFVFICGALLYGFRAGWFTRRRPAPPQQNAAQRANNQSAPAPPTAPPTNQTPAAAADEDSVRNNASTPPTAEGGAENSANLNASGENTLTTPTNQTRTTDTNSQTPWYVFWSTCYIFISSFFASLIPERPPPVNLN